MSSMKVMAMAMLYLVITGCSSVATYNPGYGDEPAPVSLPLQGKALIYTTAEDGAYIFSGHPTSFTGGGTTLTVHLGEIIHRLATRAFANIFENGADYAQSLDAQDQYTIVVKPKSTNFTYAYNQLKNAGFAITPQVDVGIHVTVLHANGEPLLDKHYASGLYDGKTYFMSGSPGDEVNKAVHEAIAKLVNDAALDTFEVLQSSSLSLQQ